MQIGKEEMKLSFSRKVKIINIQIFQGHKIPDQDTKNKFYLYIYEQKVFGNRNTKT